MNIPEEQNGCKLSFAEIHVRLKEKAHQPPGRAMSPRPTWKVPTIRDINLQAD